MPIMQELAARFKEANPKLDIQKDFNPTVWWDERGYSYRLQSSEGALIVASPGEPGTPAQSVPSTYFYPELEIANKVLYRRGFAVDSFNSSTSTVDRYFYDYVQAYKNGDELCTVVVDPDYGTYNGGGMKYAYTLTVNCANTLAQAKAEQQPFLDALDLRYKEATAYIENQSGDYYLVSFGYRRIGEAAIVKKEGSNYRVLLISQEAPPCDLVDKEKIPTELLGPMGGGGCYESDGSYREAPASQPL